MAATVPEERSVREVDLFVIGGGSGGVRAARIAAGHGARVALAEEYRVGGTCVIRGCVPKKLMVYASRFAQEFDEAPAYGWQLDGEPRLDWPTLKAHRDREVARLEGVYEAGLSKAGVTLLRERAALVDAHTVQLQRSREQFRAAHILVATGAAPMTGPAIPGVELAHNSNDLFEWPRQPQSVLIRGGGYIAVEFACLLQRLGTQVTLVLRSDRILRGFDDDLRDRLQAQMAADGIEVIPGTTVASIEAVGGARLVTLSDERTISVGEVLSAVGRAPNTAGLGLEAAGVQLDARGAVVVDRYSRSSVPHIHAVGDVTDRVNLTPVAVREGHAFADTLFGQRPTAVDHRNVPSAVFSTPELGTVGLNEDEALQARPMLDVYTADFRPLKATLSGHPHRVFMKLIVDRADDERVLGFHMLGPDAGEMIQLLGVAIKMGARKSDLDATLAVHPTAAEEWVTLRTPTRQLGL
jgi:glutathione reductase (NADPH)